MLTTYQTLACLLIAKAFCSFQTPSGAQPWNIRIVALEPLATDITGLQCFNHEVTIQFKDGNSYGSLELGERSG
jgi:hypothetical protein